MKKYMLCALVSSLSLSAEYNVDRAIEIMNDIVDRALEGVKTTGNQNAFCEVQKKAAQDLLELSEQMTQEQIKTILGDIENELFSEENIKTARSFHQKIRETLLKLSVANSDEDLLNIYEELLPIIASDIQSARMFFKVFAYKNELTLEDLVGLKADVAPFKTTITIFYALFNDPSGKLLAAAMAGSRHPFSFSDKLIELYI